jgi:hypothetical protein
MDFQDVDFQSVELNKEMNKLLRYLHYYAQFNSKENGNKLSAERPKAYHS